MRRTVRSHCHLDAVTATWIPNTSWDPIRYINMQWYALVFVQEKDSLQISNRYTFLDKFSVRSGPGLVQVWFSIELKFNSSELDYELGWLVFLYGCHRVTPDLATLLVDWPGHQPIRTAVVLSKLTVVLQRVGSFVSNFYICFVLFLSNHSFTKLLYLGRKPWILTFPNA